MLELIAGGLAALVASVGLTVAASSVAARWGARARRGERASDWLLASVSLAIALVQVLGFAGQLRLGVLTAIAGCGLGVLVTASGRERLRASIADLRAGVSTVARSLPLATAAVLGLLLAARGLRLPELSWDGLTYHLTYPATWLQAGAFVRFEAGGVWEQYESFPKGGEALFAWAMLPFHADHFVHWVNLPLWAGVGCALRAALLRMDVSQPAADLCVLLALACPALSAYVTPAYVEVPAAFAACAALGAATRALWARDAEALTPLWLSLCLGGAIKVTALAYLPAGVLVTLLAMRALTPARCLRPLARGIALGSVVLLPWYVNNAVVCLNPLYPAAFLGLPGTVANAWAVRETSVLTQAALADVLDGLARAPWHVRYPLGPGWAALIALPACAVLGAVAWMRARQAPAARAAALLALLALGLTVVYLVSPWNGVFRDANTRFLMPAMIAAAASSTLSASLAPRWLGRALAAIGCSVVALSLANAAFVRDALRLGPELAAVVALAAAGCALLHRRWIAAGVLSAALGVWTLGIAIEARSASRFDAYEHQVDLHPGLRGAALWRQLETLPPSRIAFAVGDVNATEGWFFYPLFGSRLQHTVRYLDVEAVAPRACLRRGSIRDRPDEAAWLRRVREARIDYVVLAGEPTEHAWVRARTAAFKPVFQSGNIVLYQVGRF